jgi:APA family basic amino acid/polyamine antiporter
MGLKRVLGTGDAAWLVAGNMIGAGIFITPGFVAGYLPGVVWPLVAWMLGGLLALCGAAVYGELGSRLPRAGGDYQYLARAFGPLWGFLMGWSALVLTFSAAAAAMCKVSVGHFLTAVGAAGDLSRAAQVIVPPIAVLTLTLANALGAKMAGRTTVLLTAVPLLGLCGLFAHGLISGSATTSWPAEPFASPSSPWPLALGAAMVPVFFTYSGWNAAAYVAGELKDPGRTLARALLVGTTAVALLYAAVNTALLAALGDDLAGTAKPGADAATRLLGSGAELVLSLFIAVAVLGSANVTLMAGARIYYAMALDRLLPPFLARTGRSGVPSAALWCGGVFAAILAAIGGVRELVEWASLAIMLLSSLTVVALFVLRRRDPGSGAFLCPGYPAVPVIYLLTCLGVAVSSTLYDWRRALWGVLLVAAGFPLYWLVRRFVPPLKG